MKRLRLLIRDVIRRDRFARDMRDELEAFLELSAEDHLTRRGERP